MVRIGVPDRVLLGQDASAAGGMSDDNDGLETGVEPASMWMTCTAVSWSAKQMAVSSERDVVVRHTLCWLKRLQRRGHFLAPYPIKHP